MHRAPVKRRDADPSREVSAGESAPLAQEKERKKPLGSQCEPYASHPGGRAWAGEGPLHMDAPSWKCPSWSTDHSLHPPNAPLLNQGPSPVHTLQNPCWTRDPPAPFLKCLSWSRDPPSPNHPVLDLGLSYSISENIPCWMPDPTLQWTRNPHALFIPWNLGPFRDFQARELQGGGTVKRRAVTLLKGTTAPFHGGLKYVESKNWWPRSQGGDRNLAEDPGEQSKNRKMHRQAWKVIKTKFRLNTQRVSYALGRLIKGNFSLQSLWQKPWLLVTHREDKRRGMEVSREDRKEPSHPQISALGEICPQAAAGGHRAPRAMTAGWKTLITSCYSGHFLVSYISSKLLSLSHLGFGFFLFTS